MNPSAINKVPCNGPCLKRFRPAAVNMDQATANVLLSSSRIAGLIWLCPECHQTTHLQCTARTYSRVLSRAELPPELWIMVFKNLDLLSMIRVRSTCRRWKTIVDQNKSLQKEFWVDFKRKIIDNEFHPENLLSAPQAFISKSTIISATGWWSSFGAGLTELSITDCEIALPGFLGMLRETPNLTKLSLCSIDYTSDEELEADFRLEKLEYLICDEAIDIFAEIFPRLRKLEASYEIEDDVETSRLLTSVQGTLTDLQCNLTPFMLEQMASMDRLRLTTAEVPLPDGELVVQFSRIQPTIEKLKVTATNEELCEIGRNLAQLKEISVVFEQQGLLTLTFPAEMSQLTSLHLDSLEQFGLEEGLNLTSYNNANLINLKLESFRFTAGSLRRFLAQCPNVQTLKVYSCSLTSWSEIFKARVESLRRVSLFNVEVTRNVMKVPKELKHLNELNLTGCKISLDMLVMLLLRCPRLEKLTLTRITTIDDEFVWILDQLPQLKELSIHKCAITRRSLELIAEYYSHLKVDIRSDQISNAALKLLKYVTRT